ncbi:MAG: 30S ribosome-binding factor RbfA [Acidobacteriaceae bacterium]
MMPEHRGRTYHQNRVAETLREEISAMLEGQLSDPRINFGYVSEVVMAPGGKSARIYVAVDGDSKDEEEMLAGLEAARGYIRHQLLQRMGVRHIPELFFQVDHSEPVRARIDELLGRVERRNRQKEKLQQASAQKVGAVQQETRGPENK